MTDEEGFEFVGEVELAREEVDTAGFDQGHAQAIDRLRTSRAFMLFTHVEFVGDYWGIEYKQLLPAGDEYRPVRLGFADTLERAAAEIREMEGEPTENPG